MNESLVERSIWIDAPRERVWQAISDPRQIAQWFMPPALGASMVRDEAGTLFVDMGGMQVPIAILENLDPPRQLTSRSLPDGITATIYTLEPEKGGTRVTVTMKGLDTFSAQARQERIAPSSAGWDKALQNLKAYLDDAVLPFPEGYVSSLFGYRRESKTMTTVERSVWLPASPERVWQAITDPKELQQWFSPAAPWRTTALKPGGEITIYDAASDSYKYLQIIDAVEPPHRFVTHSQPEPPEISYTSTWTLVAENGGTRLSLAHSGYERQSDEVRHGSIEQNTFGFGMMMENLSAYLKGSALPYPFGF